MSKYKIIERFNGNWVYKNGDIIGIDNRTFELISISYQVQNCKTKRFYKKEFLTRYAANKFIKELKCK